MGKLIIFSLKDYIYNYMPLISFKFSEAFVWCPSSFHAPPHSIQKTLHYFQFFSLRILSSFSVGMVSCSLQNSSTFKENKHKIKNAYWTLNDFEKEPQVRGKYYRAERKVPVHQNLSLLSPKQGGHAPFPILAGCQAWSQALSKGMRAEVTCATSSPGLQNHL